MSCYKTLAQYYDTLTSDVDYKSFIDLYKTEFNSDGGEFNLILDLCCGTGTISKLLSDNGFDVIAVDSSEEMLMSAREKSSDILFLLQDATELDLYGTVDACISSLDSINYIKREDFNKVLKKLKLFIRPNGLFIFDIREQEFLKNMDGKTSVDETDNLLALWRADYDIKEDALIYGMDIFTKEGKLWKRTSEEHIEYCYSHDFIMDALEKGGFEYLKTINGDKRLFYVFKRR